jgi:hypothetical protein
LALSVVGLRAQDAPAARVAIVRTPESGLQPRAAVDASGVVHLVYFVGDPMHGELRYVRSSDAAKTFSAPLAIDPGAKNAIATGNVRGAQLALGRAGRVHVAWNGVAAQPGAPSPMLYTRLDADGKAFEPARDVIAKHHGLDGGGAVAADGAGNVYVVWHAPGDGGQGEEARRVWVACSHDDGATFAEEIAASEPGWGVCPCCGLCACALDGGGLAIVYRCAKDHEHRDTTLLLRKDAKSPFRTRKLDEWKVAACVMSTASLARGPKGPIAAWETSGQVRFSALDATDAHAPPENEHRRKHPSLAVNAAGELVIAWSDDMTWGSASKLSWQRYAADGTPLESALDVATLPPWSLSSVVALADGRFVVFY